MGKEKLIYKKSLRKMMEATDETPRNVVAANDANLQVITDATNETEHGLTVHTEAHKEDDFSATETNEGNINEVVDTKALPIEKESNASEEESESKTGADTVVALNDKNDKNDSNIEVGPSVTADLAPEEDAEEEDADLDEQNNTKVLEVEENSKMVEDSEIVSKAEPVERSTVVEPANEDVAPDEFIEKVKEKVEEEVSPRNPEEKVEEVKIENTIEQHVLPERAVTLETEVTFHSTGEPKQEAMFTCDREEDAEAIAAMILAASAGATALTATNTNPENSTSIKTDNDIMESLMKRLSESVLQVTDNLKHVAITLNEQHKAEIRELQQRRKRKEQEKMEHEAKLNAAIERGEQLGQLEKLKTEVMENRSGKVSKLKRMAQRAVMIEKKKRDIEESPTSILNSSKHFLVESGENNDQEESQRFDNEIYHKVEDESRQSIHESEREQSEDIEPTYEMRMAKRSALAEELRSAKEVRRHIMASFAQEREEERLAQINEGKEGSTSSISKKHHKQKFVAGIPMENMCEMLSCAEEDLQNAEFFDSEIDPVVESIVHITIRNFVSDINGYDDRLSDIETMQSILLAENAASKGIDAFKIGKEGIQIGDTDISDVPLDPMAGAILLAEQAAARGEQEFKIDSEGITVKNVTPIFPPKGKKKIISSEFENISKRAKEKMSFFRKKFEKPKLWMRRQVENE